MSQSFTVSPGDDYLNSIQAPTHHPNPDVWTAHNWQADIKHETQILARRRPFATAQMCFSTIRGAAFLVMECTEKTSVTDTENLLKSLVSTKS